MIDETPRVRMFAGPNGSGKSTLKSVLRSELLATYVNPDDIERELKSNGRFDCGPLRIAPDHGELKTWIERSPLLQSGSPRPIADRFGVAGSTIAIPVESVDSYVASVLADYLRHALVAGRRSFTFETVMSSPDKVAFLGKSRASGYRTYLYYIATEDPAINVVRVRNRVIAGGHPVPEDKIVSRYFRSLDLLADAIRASNRAYIFDNSRDEQVWLAEIVEGSAIDVKARSVPHWFQKSVLDKL